MVVDWGSGIWRGLGCFGPKKGMELRLEEPGLPCLYHVQVFQGPSAPQSRRSKSWRKAERNGRDLGFGSGEQRAIIRNCIIAL